MIASISELSWRVVKWKVLTLASKVLLLFPFANHLANENNISTTYVKLNSHK